MADKELVLKIDHVSKQYRLGAIGGGTLQGDLQSWWAKIRGKEDPNSVIGSKSYEKHKKFWALDDINIEIYKGETVGIIGHNGAGKSTLLKLLSRVTAPTNGEISIKGRVSSMLEVGTGFHGELTGRQNIYLNGAILGMSKAEIDSKIEEIIEFSECREFIDTPVKRYSSGMYVKLAFAVAAHLDNEILVMDEVLAVGDMKFQKKCLGKMGDVADAEGRTVLYVSHNMNTIRTLCSRCIVLDHGKVIFDGDTETAIAIYSDVNNTMQKHTSFVKEDEDYKSKVKILSSDQINSSDCTYMTDSVLEYELEVYSPKDYDNVDIRQVLKLLDEEAVGVSFSNKFNLKQGGNTFRCVFDMNGVPPGGYLISVVMSLDNGLGAVDRLDVVDKALNFTIIPVENYCNNLLWTRKSFGTRKFSNLLVEER